MMTDDRMTELAEMLPSPERMKSVIAAHISDHPDVVEYGEYTGTLPQDERLMLLFATEAVAVIKRLERERDGAIAANKATAAAIERLERERDEQRDVNRYAYGRDRAREERDQSGTDAPVFGTRICPRRDGPCQYGPSCPYNIDQYRCEDEPFIAWGESGARR